MSKHELQCSLSGVWKGGQQDCALQQLQRLLLSSLHQHALQSQPLSALPDTSASAWLFSKQYGWG